MATGLPIKIVNFMTCALPVYINWKRGFTERRIKMDESYKEVYFHGYCKTCKHEKEAETDDPCWKCLENPVNVYSHKPTHWEEKE